MARMILMCRSASHGPGLPVIDTLAGRDKEPEK
jgi:hypothetical protein